MRNHSRFQACHSVRIKPGNNRPSGPLARMAAPKQANAAARNSQARAPCRASPARYKAKPAACAPANGMSTCSVVAIIHTSGVATASSAACHAAVGPPTRRAIDAVDSRNTAPPSSGVSRSANAVEPNSCDQKMPPQ